MAKGCTRTCEIPTRTSENSIHHFSIDQLVGKVGQIHECLMVTAEQMGQCSSGGCRTRYPRLTVADEHACSALHYLLSKLHDLISLLACNCQIVGTCPLDVIEDYSEDTQQTWMVPYSGFFAMGPPYTDDGMRHVRADLIPFHLFPGHDCQTGPKHVSRTFKFGAVLTSRRGLLYLEVTMAGHRPLSRVHSRRGLSDVKRLRGNAA